MFSFFAAEKFLESVEANQNYAILLLNLVGKEDLDINVRVSGAIAFKNFVKRNWNPPEVKKDLRFIMKSLKKKKNVFFCVFKFNRKLMDQIVYMQPIVLPLKVLL